MTRYNNMKAWNWYLQISWWTTASTNSTHNN